MKKVILGLFTVVCLSAEAQHPNILISSEQVPNEVSIAMDKKDMNHLYAGANIASYYTSANGGLSWKKFTQESTYGVWGDPVVAIDTAGTYYHFHLSKPKDGDWLDRIVCQTSTDRGLTFNNGSYTGLNGDKDQDKHWVVIDPKNNHVYLTWTQFDKYDSPLPEHRSNIMFSKSTDGGATWTEAKTINAISGDCLDGDNTVEGAVPCIGPKGEIYVSWAGPAGLVFNRSLDGGETWLDQEIPIDPMPGGWAIDIPGIYRANGMPITKCDVSGGEFNGTIYVNWADQRNGPENTDIWLSKSFDGGNTWSKPAKVNGDTSNRHQFFTWMDIDQSNGNLYFVYHDRRNFGGDTTEVYLAHSTNAGKYFQETKISEKPFAPSEKVFFGDYNNITAHKGVVRPVWTRLDDQKLSIYTAIVDTDLVLNSENGDFQVRYGDKSLKASIIGPRVARLILKDINGEIVEDWGPVEITPREENYAFTKKHPEGVYFVESIEKTKTYRRQVIIPGY